jgi:hypothetical protein
MNDDPRLESEAETMGMTDRAKWARVERYAKVAFVVELLLTAFVLVLWPRHPTVWLAAYPVMIVTFVVFVHARRRRGR